MKKKRVFSLTFALVLSIGTCLGQLHIDEFYENKDEYLIYSLVEEFDPDSISDLHTKVKNWAGQNFVNMNEVLVSETQDQLVFNFITNSFYTTTLGVKTSDRPYYIRLIVQFRDNRLRAQFFDDGNVALANASTRQYKFAYYFRRNGNAQSMANEGLINVKDFCASTAQDIISSIRSETAGTGISDDW